MKYTVELSELALRELAKLTGKSYSEVTRSDMNISHTVEDYIHTSFKSKPKTLSEFLVDKVIENGFEKGTDFKDNCLFEFDVPYASTQIVSMIPCIGLTDEEINEFDLYRKTFTGTYNDIWLCFNSFGISHFQITVDGEREFDVPLKLEQREKLLEAFDYHICAYDKDKNRNILCALSKNLDEAKDIAVLMMKAETQRTDKEREKRNVPDIDYVNIMDNDDFCIGWVYYNSDKEICEYEPNRMENILSVNGKNEDMFLKTVKMLEDVCGTNYRNLDVRRKENFTFVIPDKYVDEVMDRVKNDERYSFSYYDFDTSLIPLAKCDKPCIRNDNEVRMPVIIDKRVLSKRTNPLNSIPDDKLRDSEFFIVFGKNETYLEGRYDDTKVKIPMTANEKGYFKDIVRTKEPDFEKKIHKEKANMERD